METFQIKTEVEDTYTYEIYNRPTAPSASDTAIDGNISTHVKQELSPTHSGSVSLINTNVTARSFPSIVERKVNSEFSIKVEFTRGEDSCCGLTGELLWIDRRDS